MSHASSASSRTDSNPTKEKGTGAQGPSAVAQASRLCPAPRAPQSRFFSHRSPIPRPHATQRPPSARKVMRPPKHCSHRAHTFAAKHFRPTATGAGQAGAWRSQGSPISQLLRRCSSSCHGRFSAVAQASRLCPAQRGPSATHRQPPDRLKNGGRDQNAPPTESTDSTIPPRPTQRTALRYGAHSFAAKHFRPTATGAGQAGAWRSQKRHPSMKVALRFTYPFLSERPTTSADKPPKNPNHQKDSQHTHDRVTDIWGNTFGGLW
jgi:hypothetical protein